MPLKATIIIPSSAASLNAMLEGFVRMQQQLLHRRERTPPLYMSGIKYRNEPPGQDHWATVPEVLKQGWGDCEDLAGWRAAELRQMGEHAHAVAVKTRSGKWHAVVLRADCSVEDPSRIVVLLERHRKGRRR